MLEFFQNLKLKIKVILLISVINLISTGLYTYFTYDLNKDNKYKSINEKLYLSAMSARKFIEYDYHDRIKNSSSIGIDEYMKKLVELSDFAEKIGIEYLYSMVKVGDRIYFTMSSGTAEDIEEDNLDYFFDEYDNATEALKNSFNGNTPVFEESVDSYGHFRSILVPFKNAKGETYIIGADIQMDYIHAEMREIIIQSIIIGSITFAISLAIAIFLFNIIIKQVPIIQNGLIGFFKFLHRETSNAELIPLNSKDELGEMAKMINYNIKKVEEDIKKDDILIENITNLTEAIKEGSLGNRLDKYGSNPSLNRMRDEINSMLDNMQSSFGNILDVIKEYSDQNYVVSVKQEHFVDDFKELIDSVNKLGKDISSVIVKSGYDSLSLQKSSNNLAEYMESIKYSSKTFTKELNEAYYQFVDIKKYSLDLAVKFEKILFHTDIVNKSAQDIEKITSKLKIDDEKTKLALDNLTDDSKFHLEHLKESLETTLSVINNQKLFLEVMEQLIAKLNEITQENTKISQNTTTIVDELANISARIREDVVSKNFIGKENITIFLQYIDR